LIYQFATIEKREFKNNESKSVLQLSEAEVSKSVESSKLTFLGTEAMCFSKYRSVSGILAQLKSGFIDLDCGEGFTGQLKRRFGLEFTRFVLTNIRVIFISHKHGDHHFGLYQFLQERAKISETDVSIICPAQVSHHIENLGLINSGLKLSSVQSFSSRDIELKPIYAYHCKELMGCLLTLEKKHKIAYSGDKSFFDGSQRLRFVHP
jgi:ribonuclease BN (tRNA processing enzyme)